MSFFDILESRMQQLFEGNRMLAPLPFKKLAKSAVREMKRSSVKIDGRHLAPTLFTILVNEADDQAMAPLYQEVTDELVDFLAHEAQADGLELTASPIVRFIPEPTIKLGRADVIAEMVTPEVLEQIREEESAYVEQHVSAAGGTVRPAGRAAQPAAPSGAASVPNIPEVAPAPASAPQQREIPGMVRGQAPSQAKRTGVPGIAPMVPVGTSRPAAQTSGSGQTRRPAQAGGSTTCQLTDTKSGRTWRISTPSTIIGREEASADLVLSDSNVSRKHAELSRTEDGWVIADLGSTNGTRINGQRISSQGLNSGDTITLGLIELQFEEL